MKKIHFVLLIIILKEIKVELFNNAIYNLILKDKYFSYYKNKIQIINSTKFARKSKFRIKIYPKSLCNIEHVESNLILTVVNSKLKLIPKLKKTTNTIWFLLEITNNNYIIKNMNECYIYYKNNNLKCEKIKRNEASIFYLVKIYEELNHSQKDLELIEKEPIDLVVKYIDLRDPYLKRKGIPQIKKDEDNQELKYSIRSVLKNIPWVRKIFIILPNKKVRYFKDYNLIKEKIVYINDKDLLGFDSSNIYTFHFNYWKLKEKYNVSENIISMDDDYFIGKPLKKSDFFYVDHGKVTPAIITTSFKEVSKDKLLISLNNLKLLAKEAKERQNDSVYYYTIGNTLLFILSLLKKEKIIAPKFTHNALPCNLKDIKEMYDLVYKSEFKSSTLDSIYRGIETLQFQSFYITYKFNKNYNTKVNPISCAYIDHNNAILANYNYSLFVINTGGLDYSPISFKKARLAMETIFPEPTPYEIIINNSYFHSLAFNIVYELDKEIEELKLKNVNKNNIVIFDKVNILLFFIIISKIVLIFGVYFS